MIHEEGALFHPLRDDRTGDERAAEEFVKSAFDFRPRMIIEKLNLLRPIYRGTTNYGHFGRPGLPWETVEKAAAVAR